MPTLDYEPRSKQPRPSAGGRPARTKLTVLRDVGTTCVIIGGIIKLFEQPVYGDPHAMSRTASIVAGCGFVVLFLWASLWASAARREERERDRGNDVAPPTDDPRC